MLSSAALSIAFTTEAPVLRELGVYTLPDGGEYVASTPYADGCCLYTFGGPDIQFLLS
jgi:hypothetical protein